MPPNPPSHDDFFLYGPSGVNGSPQTSANDRLRQLLASQSARSNRGPMSWDFAALAGVPLSRFGAVGNGPQGIPSGALSFNAQGAPPPRFSSGSYGGGAVADPRYSMNTNPNPWRAVPPTPDNRFDQTSDTRRVFRDMASALHNIDRAEKRLLYLAETSHGTVGREMNSGMWGFRATGRNTPNSFLNLIHPAMAAGPSRGNARASAAAANAANIAAGVGIPPRPPPPPPPTGSPPTPPGGGGGGDGGGANLPIGMPAAISAMLGITQMLGIGRFGSGAFRAGGAIAGRAGAYGVLGMAVGGEAAWRMARLPLGVGRFAEGLFNESRPYTDLQNRLAATTRGSGQDFRKLSGQLIGQSTPEWMSRYGITPDKAVSSMEGIGGLRPGMNMQAYLTYAKQLSLSTGFAQLPAGSVESSALQGMRYGIGGKDNPLLLATQYGNVLAEAFRQGADEAEVFKSIRGAVEETAKFSVIGPNTTGINNMFQQLMQTDVPGGKSGALGARLIGGVEGALDNPFENPARAVVLDQIRRSVDWNDPKSIDKVLGEGATERLMRTDYGKAAIGSLRIPNAPQAFTDQALGVLLKGNPTGALDQILKQSGMFSNMQGPLGDLMRMNFAGKAAGVRPEDMGGFQQSRGLPLQGAGALDASTLATPEMRAEVEASMDLYRGMEAHFKIFGTNLELINKEFGPYIKSIGDASAALMALTKSTGHSPETSGLPPLSPSNPLPGTRGASSPPAGAAETGFGGQMGGGSSSYQFSGGRGGTGAPATGGLSFDPLGGRYPAGTERNLPAPGAPSSGDPRGMIPVIRAAAIRAGIDPDVAVNVARHEGLETFVGDYGKSFGAMQLHRGGGLGDAYMKETGHDPSDPKYESETIDYAMRYAAKHGWGEFHGAARAGYGPHSGIGGTPPSNTSTVPSGGSAGAGAAVDDIMSLYGLDHADPKVRSFVKSHGGTDPASVAGWCAILTNSALSAEGIKGTGSNLASSFHNWGAKVSDPANVRRGDVLVAPPSMGFSGHVGLATGHTQVDPATGQFQIEMASSNSWDPKTGLQSIVGKRWRNASSLDIRRATEREDPHYAEHQEGGGVGQAAAHGLSQVFDHLTGVVKQVAEHMHELGYATKKASNMKVTSASPNSSTSRASSPVGASYP